MEPTENETARPVHVVTCFLLRQVGATHEVLLVQRSQRVRTYKGAWGGVSGYLEPNVEPLTQAYTEIREETQLQAADVRLLRIGEPLGFRDETLGQNWVVHPFLFALNASERIQTDWEATALQWVKPEQLRRLETVPMLAEAYERAARGREAAPDAAG